MNYFWETVHIILESILAIEHLFLGVLQFLHDPLTNVVHSLLIRGNVLNDYNNTEDQVPYS